MKRVILFAVLPALASVSACAGAGQDGPADGPTIIEDAGGLRYVVAGSPDADGCQAYRRYAPGRMLPQIVYYRRADGCFTVNRQEADCGSD